MLRRVARLRGGGDLAPAGAVRDARRLAAARRRAAAPPGSAGRSAVRPAPTGSSSGTPTRSSAGPAPAGARTLRTNTWTCRRSRRRASFYAELVRAYLGGDMTSDGRRPRTLWSYRPGREPAHARLHRRRRPALGRPAAALGRARQPRPHRRAARCAAPVGAGACPAPRRLASGARGGRPGRLRRRTGARGRRTRRSRTGSPGACPASASGSTPAARATTRSPATSGSTSRTRCSRCTRRRSTSPTCCSPSPHGTGRCSGPATPISGGRCRRRWGSGPAPTPKDCSTPSRRSPALWAAGGSLAARQRGRLRRAAAAPARGGGRARSASPGWTATWPRCRGAAASSRRRCCSGAPSWATTLARLAQDVILFSAEEFGYLVLPAGRWPPGSSIMPHKRNPDLFELTRGRAAALEGDLVSGAADQGQARRRLPSRLPAAQGAAHARARAHARRCWAWWRTRCRSSRWIARAWPGRARRRRRSRPTR